MPYTMVVERDPESGWLVGSVVELPGCYTQAQDLAELERGMKEAIASHLGALDPDEPSPEFVGTWKIEVAA